MNDIIDEIINKKYSFDDNQNKNLPADFWFQNPTEGLTLFIVFYTQACRWTKCLGCNLPSKMSQFHIGFEYIMKQIDFIFDFHLSNSQKRDLRKIIISNNGSVLDEKTFSTTAFIYFVSKMNMNCPNISCLTIETRPEYVDWEELEIISRALKEGQTPTNLEIAIGFEAYDDKIRNEHFNKGLTLQAFEDLAKNIRKYGYMLKTYFMLKPVPNLTEDEAIQDIFKAIAYIDSISSKYNININMHLNPTYVAYGTPLEEAFRNNHYTPPSLESIVKCIMYTKNKSLSIYIGLNDEGLAVEGGSFMTSENKDIINKITQFNKTQDYSLF